MKNFHSIDLTLWNQSWGYIW